MIIQNNCNKLENWQAMIKSKSFCMSAIKEENVLDACTAPGIERNVQSPVSEFPVVKLPPGVYLCLYPTGHILQQAGSSNNSCTFR